MLITRVDYTSFEQTEEMHVLFDSMGKNQQRWITHHSALMDCINFALETGGIVETDMLVEEYVFEFGWPGWDMEMWEPVR